MVDLLYYIINYFKIYLILYKLPKIISYYIINPFNETQKQTKKSQNSPKIKSDISLSLFYNPSI